MSCINDVGRVCFADAGCMLPSYFTFLLPIFVLSVYISFERFQAQCGLERPTFGGLWMCSAEPTDAQTSFSTKAGMKNVHPHWFSTAKAMVAKHASFRQAMSTIS